MGRARTSRTRLARDGGAVCLRRFRTRYGKCGGPQTYNIILYLAASSSLTLASYSWGGLMSLEILKIATFAEPAYGVGALMGSRMFGIASPRLFRNMSLGLIALAVALSLPVFG